MNTETPLVSVKMITYNHEKFIAQAIEGVLMQKTDFPFELVIGEDCSTDRTREIVVDYANRYPEIIKPILHEKNVGAKANSESVGEACTGKYVALCEGDDYWTDPLKLQKQVEIMQANPHYSVCFHYANVVTTDNEFTGRFLGRIKGGSRQVTFDEVAPGFFPTASKVYRADIVGTMPDFYFMEEAGDFSLWLIILDKGNAYYIDESLSAYRIGVPGSANDRHSKKTKEEVIEYYETRVKILDLFDSYSDGRHKTTIRTMKAQYKTRAIGVEGRLSERIRLLKRATDYGYFDGVARNKRLKLNMFALFPNAYKKLANIKQKFHL